MNKMKKSLLISIKLLLAVLFLYNIGFFALFSHLEDGPQPPIKADGGKSDIRYLQEKVQRAQSLGVAYGPEEYFADLTAIRLKEQQNDFDRFAILAVSSSVNQLLSTFDANVKAARRNLSETEYNLFMQRLSQARQLSQETLDPGCTQRVLADQARRQSPGYWQQVVMIVLTWLAGFYVKNLPLAFILLWIWWYQDKNKLGINNPLSFLICLTFYPIVIIRTWYQIWHEGVRTFAFRVERQRREIDIFSLLSANELAEVSRFAHSRISLTDYRQELDQRGLSRRHSLLPIMVVVTIALLIPSLASANTIVDDNIVSVPSVSVSVADSNSSPPTLQSEWDWSAPMLPPALISIAPESSLMTLVASLTPGLLPGYQRSLDPVPLFN